VTGLPQQPSGTPPALYRHETFLTAVRRAESGFADPAVRAFRLADPPDPHPGPWIPTPI